MNIVNKPRKPNAFLICYCGVLSLFAAVLQLFPHFFPFIGLFFSPFSTLPIYISVIKGKGLGFLCYGCTLFLILIFNVQEAIIFLCTTGPLGLALGFCYNKKMAPIHGSILSGIVLFLGIAIMGHLLGISPLGDFLEGGNYIVLLFFYFIFSFLWSLVWTFILNKYIPRFTQFTSLDRKYN